MLVKHVHDMADFWSMYCADIDKIYSCIKDLENRLKAIINPTAENKLAAISSREPAQLYETILDIFSSLVERKKEIYGLAKEVLQSVEEQKIKCDECSGRGYKRKPFHDKDNPAISYDMIDCENCTNGYLSLTKGISGMVKIVFKALVEGMEGKR